MPTHRIHGDGDEPPITIWAASIYGATSRRGLVRAGDHLAPLQGFEFVTVHHQALGLASPPCA